MVLRHSFFCRSARSCPRSKARRDRPLLSCGANGQDDGSEAEQWPQQQWNGCVKCHGATAGQRQLSQRRGSPEGEYRTAQQQSEEATTRNMCDGGADSCVCQA